MCHYSDVLGSGDALTVQIVTLAAIALGIGSWILVFRKMKVPLAPYALPIALWVLFGSLDITITARGTFGQAWHEGNPFARFVFEQAGFFGPAIASMLWISLWSGLVLALNWKNVPHARLASLAVFYSLAVGHFSCFGSWFMPLCAVAKVMYFPHSWPVQAFLYCIIGTGLAAMHMAVARRIEAGGKKR